MLKYYKTLQKYILKCTKLLIMNNSCNKKKTFAMQCSLFVPLTV